MGKKWRDIITMCLPLLSITIAAISLIKGCLSDRQMERIRYEQMAMNYQPRIQMLGDPNITECMLDTTAIHVNMHRFYEAIAEGKQPHVDMSTSFLVSYEINLVNTGNALGGIVAVASGDTLSTINVLREILLSSRINAMEISNAPKYFVAELRQGSVDTTRLRVDCSVRRHSNNEFAMHFLILYKNQLEQYFDTYYIIHYAILQREIPFVYVDGRILIDAPWKHLKILQQELVPQYKIYTKDEQDKLKARLDRATNESPSEPWVN